MSRIRLMAIGSALLATAFLLTGGAVPGLALGQGPFEKWLVVASAFLFSLLPMSLGLRKRAGVVLGGVVLLAVGPFNFFGLLIGAPSLLAVLSNITRPPWRKFAVLILVLMVSYQLRFFFPVSFWSFFLLSYWLKLVSVVVDGFPPEQGLAQRILQANLFFFAPPFLLSPLAFEWIRFGYFQVQAERSVFDDKRALHSFARSLTCLIAWRYGAEPLAQLVASEFSPGDPAAAWPAQAVWGYAMFLERYLLLSGLTSAGVGFFQLAGWELKHDYHLPFLARDFLEFWGRYHFYARDFLFQHVYLPVFFFVPRKLPFSGHLAAGMLAVVVCVAFVHHLNFVPGGFSSDSAQYSFQGALQHTTVSALFIIVSVFVRKFVRRRLARPSVLADCAFWLLTQLMVGYFFFGAYWNLWRVLPMSRYFLKLFGA